MAIKIGQGQLSLIDLNDVIASDTPPSNPQAGAMWFKESERKLYVYNNNNQWIPSTIVLEEEIEDISESIENITETLGNMANDNILDFEERQVIKDKLTNILGLVLSDTIASIPTVATLDASLKGDFYTVRKSALNAGMSVLDAPYVAVETAYNSLRTYLNGMIPIKPWDLRSTNEKVLITVDKNTFRNNWLNYYNAVSELSVATALKLKTTIEDIEKATGNLVENPSISSVVGRWSRGSDTSIDNVLFEDKTIPVLKSTTSGDVMVIHEDVLVDPSKAYEVTMWLNQDSTGGITYVGLYSTTSIGSYVAIDVVDNMTGAVTNSSNPYAWSGKLGAANNWVKKTFYIMPVGTDSMLMKNIGSGVTSNFRMKADTRRIRVRYLNWSNAGTSRTIWMAHPKMVEVDPNAIANLSKLNDRVHEAEQKITKEAITTTVTASDAWTTQSSKIESLANKVSIVVTDENKVNADAVASALTVTPTAIDLISRNINLSGRVTFSSFDSPLQTDLNVLNGWKATGKTTIDGGKIETRTITASQIKADTITANEIASKTITASQIKASTITANEINTSTLVVGDNIAMGSNASISWGRVTSKPTIPTTASDVGAVANSQNAVFNALTNNGISRGLFMNSGNLYVNADYINGGEISGIKVVTTSGNNVTTIHNGAVSVFNGVYTTTLERAGIFITDGKTYQPMETHYFLEGINTNRRFKFGTYDGGSIDFTGATVTGLNIVPVFG